MTTPISYVHTKHFSYNEASSALALVKPIVSDILSKKERWNELRAKLNTLQADDFCQHSEIQVLETGLRILAREIKYHLEELEQVGCLLKDPINGVVDFPSIYQNTEVYLCWKFGDPTILEYHGIDENRQLGKEIPFDMIS